VIQLIKDRLPPENNFETSGEYRNTLAPSAWFKLRAVVSVSCMYARSAVSVREGVTSLWEKQTTIPCSQQTFT